MPKLLPIAFAATIVSTAAGALAQDTDPKLPPPSQQVPEKIRPESDGSAGGATLSEKLEKSDGVIKPPGGVDPEIKTIPPDNSGSSMPIIKPQGDAK
ncbi:MULTISPECIES: hypothetical protein [Methylobacterium]|uniref:Uncharacterized protein n=1 Tax=Methylobacterium thuringiense TaxID=1003091 RepID=A0ABQ4TMT7_9HYPH|nr:MULTISPECIES: hypothetical protein [Methylobacterium]TXN19822.1 hypothetical protein FV217_20070 [Methylobacterium sp. WL9]GJE55350.1 hypothetical protein EKPJFOCH_1841 [Methylobacterium thuringiense]